MSSRESQILESSIKEYEALQKNIKEDFFDGKNQYVPQLSSLAESVRAANGAQSKETLSYIQSFVMNVYNNNMSFLTWCLLHNELYRVFDIENDGIAIVLDKDNSFEILAPIISLYKRNSQYIEDQLRLEALSRASQDYEKKLNFLFSQSNMNEMASRISSFNNIIHRKIALNFNLQDELLENKHDLFKETLKSVLFQYENCPSDNEARKKELGSLLKELKSLEFSVESKYKKHQEFTADFFNSDGKLNTEDAMLDNSKEFIALIDRIKDLIPSNNIDLIDIFNKSDKRSKAIKDKYDEMNRELNEELKELGDVNGDFHHLSSELSQIINDFSVPGSPFFDVLSENEHDYLSKISTLFSELSAKLDDSVSPENTQKLLRNFSDSINEYLKTDVMTELIASKKVEPLTKKLSFIQEQLAQSNLPKAYKAVTPVNEVSLSSSLRESVMSLPVSGMKPSSVIEAANKTAKERYKEKLTKAKVSKNTSDVQIENSVLSC